MTNVKSGRDYDDNPSINRFVREPGHIEYAPRSAWASTTSAKFKCGKIEM